MRNKALFPVVVVTIFLTSSAWGVDPAARCESQKVKAIGKYVGCLAKLDAKAAIRGEEVDPADTAKCADKFLNSWDKAQASGDGLCSDPPGADASVAQATAALCEAWGASYVQGGEPDICAGACDSCLSELDLCVGSLGTCESDLLSCLGQRDRRVVATGQTISYGPGDDGDIQAGAPLQYRDNGDGTVTDLNTALLWEKKILGTGASTPCNDETGTCANPHHADNTYSWGAAFAAPQDPSPTYDGTVVTIFLEQLNNRCDQDTTLTCTVDDDCTVPGGACGFAGHRDWRLPNLKELQTIADHSKPYPGPSVDAAFHGATCGLACADVKDAACSCTASAYYWSSTTTAHDPLYAWLVYFGAGYVEAEYKRTSLNVRAVRGGS